MKPPIAIFYPEYTRLGYTHVDGTIAFYTRVNHLISPRTIVIDFGCGRGAYQSDLVEYRRNLRILRGKAARVIGLDASPAGAENPYLDEFHPLEGDTWPLADGSINLVLADHVLEHLAAPGHFFAEASRVLAPGGDLCIRTPNAWNYIALISRLVPSGSHSAVLSRVKPEVAEEDIFPTYYRCNTLPAVKKRLRGSGFQGKVTGYEAEPTYLSFSQAAYALGVLHQKIAPVFLRASIFVFAKKA